MDPSQRSLIAAIVRNVIAPGNRAILPNALVTAVEAYAQEHALRSASSEERLGRFWEGEASGLADADIRARLDLLHGVGRDIARTYGSEDTANIPYEGLQTLYYTLYYLPVNFHKIQLLLLDLFESGQLPRTLNVLDIGTGVGTIPLAILDLIRLLHDAAVLVDAESPGWNVSFTCLEPAIDNVRAFDSIWQNLPPTFTGGAARLVVSGKLDREGAFLDLLPNGEQYSLITFSNVLSELVSYSDEERTACVLHAASRLSLDGLVALIEPAYRTMTQRLHAIQRSLLDHGLHLVSPCSITCSRCSVEGSRNCWSYRAEKLRIPRFMKPLEDIRLKDRSNGAHPWEEDDFEVDRLKWSYSILSRNERPTRLVPAALPNAANANGPSTLATEYWRCAGSGGQERSQRLVVSVVSSLLPRARAFKICDGSGTTGPRVAVWNRHMPIPSVDFGDQLEVSNALIRDNRGDVWPEVRQVLEIDTRSSVEPLRHSLSMRTVRIAQGEEKRHTLETFLERLFGFQGFLDNEHGVSGQLSIISRVLRGEDAVGVIATSGGKSLCFQFPAMLLPGTCIVVAPLLSLAQDQVHILQDRFNFDNVAKLNSELTRAEREEVLNRLAAGRLKILYTTPEQFRNERFVRKLKRLACTHGINLFAIDEVHCLSQWGHDFRPAYLLLKDRFQEIDAAVGQNHHTPVLGLTATASDYVINDVCNELEIPREQVYRYSFDRPELSYQVISCSSAEHRKRKLLSLLTGGLQGVLGKSWKPGIVFVPYAGGNLKDWQKSSWLLSARGLAKELDESLHRSNITVNAYHGDLSMDERRDVQDAFIDGNYDVLVATKGFGMGIDKADVRFVVHYGMAQSLEDYYQQAGRGGRDRHHSHCVMLYELPMKDPPVDPYYRTDRERMKHFVEQNYPDPHSHIDALWTYLASLAPNWEDHDWRILYLNSDDLLADLGWVAKSDLDLGQKLKDRPTSNLSIMWGQVIEFMTQGYSVDALAGLAQRLVEGLSFPTVGDAVVKFELIHGDELQELPDLVRDILLRDIQHRLRRISDVPDVQKPSKTAVLAKIKQLLATQTTDVDLYLLQVAAILQVPELLAREQESARQNVDRALGALRRMRFADHEAVDGTARFRQKHTWAEVVRECAHDDAAQEVAEFLGSGVARAKGIPNSPNAWHELDMCWLASAFNKPNEALESTLEYLEICSFIDRLKFGNKVLMIRLAQQYAASPESPETMRAFEREKADLYERKAAQLRMLDDMQRFIDTTECRRQILVGYFRGADGDGKSIVRCGFCDNCCDEKYGERAEPVYATSRQLELISRFDSLLARDSSSGLPITLDEMQEMREVVGQFKPEKGEDPIWDLLRGKVGYYLENKERNSRRGVYLRALVLQASGDSEQATDEIARMARWCDADNRLAEAEVLYTEALRVNPEDADLLNRLYSVQKKLGRGQPDLLDTARRLAPLRDNDATLQEELADLEVSAGTVEAAVPAYIRVVQILAASDDLAGANACWLRALELASSTPSLEEICRGLAVPAPIRWRLSLLALRVLMTRGAVHLSTPVQSVLLDVIDKDLNRVVAAASFPIECTQLVTFLCELDKLEHVGLLWLAVATENRLKDLWLGMASSLIRAGHFSMASNLLQSAVLDSSLDPVLRLQMIKYLIKQPRLPLETSRVLFAAWKELLHNTQRSIDEWLELANQQQADDLVEDAALTFLLVAGQLSSQPGSSGAAAEMCSMALNFLPEIKDPVAIESSSVLQRLALGFNPTSSAEIDRWFTQFSTPKCLPIYRRFSSEALMHLLSSSVRVRLETKRRFEEEKPVLGTLRRVVLLLLKREGHETEAHRQWLTLLTAGRGLATRLPRYIEDCCKMTPPQVEFAEEAYSCLLDTNSPELVTRFFDREQDVQPVGWIERGFRIAANVKKALALRETALSGAEPEDLAALLQGFSPESNPADASLLAFIVARKREIVGIEPWLDAVSIHVEALGHAGRFEDGLNLASQFPDLLVSGGTETPLAFVQRLQDSGSVYSCDREVLDQDELDGARILRLVFGFPARS